MMKPFVSVLTSVLLLTGCGVASTMMPPAPASPTEESTGPAKTVDSTEGPITEADDTTAATADVQVKILDYDGIQALVKSHQGKVVVMDAWSLSCEPCIKEFPNLVALHKQYGPEKVACISLSFDYEGLDPPEDVLPHVKEFLEKQGATFDNAMSSVESEELHKKFSLASIPAVFVYDQQGNLAKRFDNEDPDTEPFTYEHVGKLVAELVQ